MTYTTNNVNQYTATSDPAESFSYDFDGNLSQDVGFDYAWDGENRLKTATPRNPDNGDEKVAFVYDYMGRRVRKAVYVYNSGWPAEESPNEVEHFVYDDWNVILVLNGLDGEDPGTEPDNTLVRRYTWGLDLSGTIHDAGGIGGLLAVEETVTQGSPSYWFFYDGNGNVGQVIKASDQSIAARYEYDPYGNIIGPDDDGPSDPGYGDWRDDAGAYALANPIRFSTKCFDAETGLGYWGYRYYSPRLGRWMSRDPIGESGGLNLYECAGNDPTGAIDPHGLYPPGILPPLGCPDGYHWVPMVGCVPNSNPPPAPGPKPAPPAPPQPSPWPPPEIPQIGPRPPGPSRAECWRIYAAELEAAEKMRRRCRRKANFGCLIIAFVSPPVGVGGRILTEWECNALYDVAVEEAKKRRAACLFFADD